MYGFSFDKTFEAYFKSITLTITYRFERFNIYNANTKTWHFNENKAVIGV